MPDIDCTVCDNCGQPAYLHWHGHFRWCPPWRGIVGPNTGDTFKALEEKATCKNCGKLKTEHVLAEAMNGHEMLVCRHVNSYFVPSNAEASRATVTIELDREMARGLRSIFALHWQESPEKFTSAEQAAYDAICKALEIKHG